MLTIPIIQPSKVYHRKGNIGSFESALRVYFFELGNKKTHRMNSDINTAKFSRSGIYKLSLQTEILKDYQEGEFINQDYRQK